MASERKLVTVLFADVIGSTALSERLDPERLRSVLDDYFDAMARVIESWGGTVEKFIGDAIVAVFGVPSVREDDAQRALHASLEMLDRLTQLNETFEARHHLTVNIRIGVNTGEVIAPIGESGQRLVSGDAVNVAARLEGAADPGTALVGERTYLACRADFRFGEQLRLDLKGKQGPVPARRLMGTRPDAHRGVPGLSARMVGRDAELTALSSLLDEVVGSGRPRLVTVLGQAGVGKSRLTQEFVHSVSARLPEVVVLRGRCLAAGQGITYWALGEILRGACSISLNDPAEAARHKLRSTLMPLLAAIGLGPAGIEATVAALAATAGIVFPDQALEGLEPQAVAQELARAWPRLTTAWVRGRVGILVVEDLHWAGEPMLGMLEHIIGRSEGALMVLATARPDMPETHADFGGGSENFSRISLRPLTAEASIEMLQDLLSRSELTSRLTAEILERAGGNPFFLEEIVGRLVDEGALVRSGDGLQVTEVAVEISVPDTIYALIAARIDSLSAGEKRALQEAAVVGRSFWEEPLARALSGERVGDLLRALERKGFILARAISSLQDQPEYSFRHALVHDVAYASMPKARRARAHKEVAGWIERVVGDRLDEFAELVADHYASAAGGDDLDLAWPDESERDDVRQRAFEALLRAGGAARRRFAVAKAVELQQRALDLARPDAERLRALEELGDTYDSAYGGDDARAAYQAALAIARAQPRLNGDRARLCWKLACLLAEKPGAFRRNPEPEPVDDLVSEGLAIAQDAGDRANLLIASGVSARLWSGSEPFGQGSKPDPISMAERIERVKQAMAIAHASHLPNEIRRANGALELLYGIAGEYEPMLELARRRVETLDQIESRLDQADALRQLAVLSSRFEGRYEEGLTLALRALALSKESNPHLLMHATFPVLEALYQLGRWDELQSVLDEHLKAFREDPAVECQFVRDGPAIGATVLAHRGLLADARQLAKALPEPLQDVASASAWQARLALAMGDPATARRICDGKALERRTYGPQHALAMVDALVALADWDALGAFLANARRQVDGNALLGPWCDVADGLLRQTRGDRTGARLHLEQAVLGFERFKVPFDAARARLKLAEIQESAAARATLESTRAAFGALGASPWIAEVEQTLSILA